MKPKCYLFSILIIGFITKAFCIEPLSGFYAGASAVSALVIASYNIVLCRFYECCSDRWIIKNITGLGTELDKKLYGQHLVKKVVVSHIKGHIKSSQPSKALALSFHGPTGTGKNHVSRLIAEALFKQGLRSEYVHLISATKEFPHETMLHHYKDKLRQKIENSVRMCPESLFIFDEIDKMPAGLIDTIKPYLDYHQHLEGVDYRRAVFIFLSNAGATAITNVTLQEWVDGRDRESIELRDVEKILAKAVINSETEGGLWHSELISKHLVTAFIPFLPLSRKFVQQCIRDVMVSKGYYSSAESVPKGMVDKVLAELTFYPEKEQLFSTTGCKRVAEKVDFVMLG